MSLFALYASLFVAGMVTHRHFQKSAALNEFCDACIVAVRVPLRLGVTAGRSGVTRLRQHFAEESENPCTQSPSANRSPNSSSSG